jgi:hypothetical protein
MTEQEMKKAVDALKLWRLTEREMIADKQNEMKRHSHDLARNNARSIADHLIAKG